MGKTFKLAITPNSNKVLRNIILLLMGLTIPMIIFGFLLEKNIISSVGILFGFVLVGYLVLTVFLTFLIIRKTYFIDEIVLEKDHIKISKIGEIKFSEIQKFKTFSYRGYKTFYIKLKNGDKIAIGPFNNFSTEACRIFDDFMEEFKKSFGLGTISK